MKTGSLIGIHAESASDAVPIAKKMKEAGARIAAVLAHENPGLCVDMKKIDPNIVTIARWHNPSSRWEGGQDAGTWTDAEQDDFVAHSIQLIFDRTNDEEYQASDYFCPGYNEWDPPGASGYKREAETFIKLCKEATRRSPEMTSKGLHPIRLALPGLNNGTPEWDEMQAMVRTGLFALMKQRGDIFIVHEGLWWHQDMNSGMGDLIPGAPSVPAYGGSKIGRVNYWYDLLGIDVPFVVSEWYDGGTRDETPPLTRLAYMTNYDTIIRHNPHCIGWCPFEMTNIENGAWWMVDFTPTYHTPEFQAYMVGEKDKPTLIEEDPMDKAAIIRHAEAIKAIAQDALFSVKIIVAVLNIRGGPGINFPDVGDAHRDEIQYVFAIDPPSGWYKISATEQKWISGSPTYSVRLPGM